MQAKVVAQKYRGASVAQHTSVAPQTSQTAPFPPQALTARPATQVLPAQQPPLQVTPMVGSQAVPQTPR
jgi:hypothetical protein